MHKPIKIRFIFTLLISFLWVNIMAQKYLKIKQKDGSVIVTPIADISKLTFTSVKSGIPEKKTTELLKLLSFKAFPNPATDLITINYENATQGSSTLEIYNLSGILVQKLFISKQSVGKQQFQCNVSKLPSGTYLFKLLHNNTIVFDKVIKTN